MLKIAWSWLRPVEQPATALKACVIAARSVPLWASNAASACAACRPGATPGEDTAADAGEDTAEDTGEDTAEDAAAGAHMKARAPGIVTDEDPRDTTSLGPEDTDAPKAVESTLP